MPEPNEAEVPQERAAGSSLDGASAVAVARFVALGCRDDDAENEPDCRQHRTLSLHALALRLHVGPSAVPVRGLLLTLGWSWGRHLALDHPRRRLVDHLDSRVGWALRHRLLSV